MRTLTWLPRSHACDEGIDIPLFEIPDERFDPWLGEDPFSRGWCDTAARQAAGLRVYAWVDSY